jgi:FkbM family methyltransferase
LPEKGFFLDLGAGHWQNLSNTYYLETHGWDGICVDADVRQLPGLIENRKDVIIAAVTSRTQGLVDFYMNNDCADISRLTPAGNEKKVSIATISIVSLLLDINCPIDLLSIDIEGEEVEVLESMFRAGGNPTVIIVEYLTSGVDNSENVKKLFEMVPAYELIHTTEANFIYKRRGI